jgi:hypothetical protein
MTAMATAPAISVPNESHFRAAMAPSGIINQPPSKITETSLWIQFNSDKGGERRRKKMKSRGARMLYSDRTLGSNGLAVIFRASYHT